MQGSMDQGFATFKEDQVRFFISQASMAARVEALP
jgi:hypothetical protein